MKFLKIFSFLFFFNFIFFINSKLKCEENYCSNCSNLIKQMKDLEGLLSVYRKENITLTQKYNEAIEHASKAVSEAYAKVASAYSDVINVNLKMAKYKS